MFYELEAVPALGPFEGSNSNLPRGFTRGKEAVIEQQGSANITA